MRSTPLEWLKCRKLTDFHNSWKMFEKSIVKISIQLVKATREESFRNRQNVSRLRAMPSIHIGLGNYVERACFRRLLHGSCSVCN